MRIFYFFGIIKIMKKNQLIFISLNPKKTQELAKIFAQVLIKNKNFENSALVIGLFGNLGSGKTTFIQGLAKGFKIKEKIQSPTFVIFKKYNFSRHIVETGHKHKIKGNYFSNFYHFDCYRILKPKEILNLNFKEIISNHKNIVVVEWADKIKRILPKKLIKIKFKIIDKNKRKIIFEY